MTGPDHEENVVVERLTPEASFERLAHEIRVQTLRTLDENGPLAHADLRDRVGVDDPGQFNYHLQKLDELFVREQEGEYALTPAGRRVVGAVRSGGYTSDLVGETIPADAECLLCGGPLAVHLEPEGVYVACRECNREFNSIDVPPGVLEGYDRSAVFDLVDRWVKRRLTAVEYGFCFRCDGPVDQRVRPAADDAWEAGQPEWLADLPVEAVLEHRCPRCGEQRYALVASVALLHPAVAGFHHKHGIDVRSTRMNDLDWLELGVTAVESTDPVVVSVPVTIDAETLVVAFDESFSLVEERRP
jgi:hypothetical protein